MYDLIIVGGSAVATGAGIYAARRKLKFKIITLEWGGEVARSGEIGNWPGLIETEGFELATKFRQQLDTLGAVIEEGVTVKKITKVGDIFQSHCQQGNHETIEQSKTVIIGTGVHPRELTVPGEKEFRNRGVSYCTVCDGPLFKDKVVATIGGGNSANESGIMMAALAKKVYVLTINPDMQGEAVLVEKLKAAQNVEIIPNAETTKIFGDQFVTGFEYQVKNSGQTHQLAVDGIFVHIGMIPNSNLVGDDLVDKDQLGQIVVNKFMETKTPGLFAAGDVVDLPYQQIAIATGHGVTAALRAIDYLNKLKN